MNEYRIRNLKTIGYVVEKKSSYGSYHIDSELLVSIDECKKYISDVKKAEYVEYVDGSSVSKQNRLPWSLIVSCVSVGIVIMYILFDVLIR